MNKESLEKIRNELIDCIDKINDKEVPSTDKTELMINIYKFLHPDKYEGNVKVLQKHELKLKYK